ncbi:3-oxoacyl-ACP reductase family protein [Rhodanobacter sp. Col0626]|uniref:3-oxoacyl-ACP reductase family protein n=1 Tax=Rhodanobacter sp. Col0626 TaxID=3415679 RepID=UPI003CEBD6D1
MNDNNSLAGKTALVTGGSRGIGAAIVRRLASEGVAVAFTYAASPAAADELVTGIAANGGTAVAIKADSAEPAEVQAAVAQTAQWFGRLDILVNNAGIIGNGTVDNYALADFDRIVAVNVRAVFVAVQAALVHMGEGGRIITTGSVAADRTGFAGSSAYSMSKAAVAGLTRGMARDLGPRGITVNVVQPGPTETDIVSDESVRERLRPMMALGRMGSGDEVASLVAYLARPEASYITGAALTVDGGYLA